jgi:hypothetical protein
VLRFPRIGVGNVTLIVKSAGAEKLAVTLFGPVRVRGCGVVVPVRSPVNPVKVEPWFGVALTVAA